MDDEQAPRLSADQQRVAIARCPEHLRSLFAGWLAGTHHLDGECRSCHTCDRRPHTDYCRAGLTP